MSSTSKQQAAPRTHEEPEVTQEESVPSDGTDTEGEALMKDVRNHKLHDAGSAEDRTPAKSRTGPDADSDAKAGGGGS
jgi:hypothetical protein